MLRVSQVNAPNHLNLNMHLNGEDELTFTRLSLASAFPYIFFFIGRMAYNKFRAGAARLNTSAVQNPSPPKVSFCNAEQATLRNHRRCSSHIGQLPRA